MSQVNLLNLNFSSFVSQSLQVFVCMCESMRMCQSNATGHKFNLANKHVGMHTNTHTHSEREKQLEMCRLCVTKTNCSHVQNCLAGQFFMLVECFSHFQHFSQNVQVCYRVYFIFFTGYVLVLIKCKHKRKLIKMIKISCCFARRLKGPRKCDIK